MNAEKETYKVYVCHICATKLHHGYLQSQYYLECFNQKCLYGLLPRKTKEGLSASLPFDQNIGKLPKDPYLKTTNNTKWLVVENNTDALYSASEKEEIIKSQTEALIVLENLRKIKSVKRAIIAGGAPRDWHLLWKKPADIDIFIEGSLNVSWFCEGTTNLAYQVSSRDDYFDRFIVRDVISENDTKFQFIFFKNYQLSLEEHINGFDFGVCKIAFDGRFYLNEDFLQDKTAGSLRIRKEKCVNDFSKKRFDKIISLFPSWTMNSETKCLYDTLLEQEKKLDIPF